MFDTVLVANRGEIAVRVMRTLRRLGVRSVAVYSDADADALHVRTADEAVRVGPAAARQSYLDIDRIVEAAQRTGAQAVHPGYGFLAENAAFVNACADAGLVFVGPPANAVEVMGDKIRAKQTVSAAGVPVVPGRRDHGMTDADLVVAADEVGFPVLVKPSAGGGGKGMRLVHDRADLPAALASARREAASSFGDDTLFLERFVIRPRHIEVQVMADSHGTTLHLGERECSLQRRHQKIIEEAPSALLDDELRDRYGRLAVATAEAVGYTGAGTVEFIVSGDAADEPFFMEMNTRLQVEHPVTELVTGLDLVELQLRVAAGERLPLIQDDVRLTGHAVEARVYAEDPARGFLPTGGVPALVREPAGDGVRVDSSLLEGTPVGTTYDPMLSKVVAWGPDRTSALDRLDRALSDTVLLGVGSNLTFLRSLLAHPDVRAGRLDTDLVERDLERLVAHDVPVDAYAAFALFRLLAAAGQASGPWEHVGGWRPSGVAETVWRVTGPDGGPLRVAVTGTPSDAHVRVGDGAPVRARAVQSDAGLLLTVGERTLHVLAAATGETTWLHLDGATYAVVELPPERRGDAAGSHDGDVRSPMPGTVVAVHVGEGDAVEEGQVLVVVEAMKMEHALTAPFSGVIDALNVRTTASVAVDELLAIVKPD
jgi:acetyl-CoA/propionyl-CoA carboxylase, biotin carboxylase, biotin carboxyl carrier protein